MLIIFFLKHSERQLDKKELPTRQDRTSQAYNSFTIPPHAYLKFTKLEIFHRRF